MIKKILRLGAFATAFISAVWAGSSYIQKHHYEDPNFYYTTDWFLAGTVFTATVSGYGPGNGVSFASPASHSSNFYVIVTPGTGSSESFYATASSSPLSAYTECAIGVSATANGPGAYCTATLVADW